MTTTENQAWSPCSKPKAGDTLKWQEPLWAAPKKPRGKRDKIGEQAIIAKLTSVQDVWEFSVISATKLSSDDAALTVKAGDTIRRKKSTITQGLCHKLSE